MHVFSRLIPHVQGQTFQLQNQKPKGEPKKSEISSSFCWAWLRRGNHWQRGLRLFHALPSLLLQPDVVCFGAAAWHGLAYRGSSLYHPTFKFSANEFVDRQIEAGQMLQHDIKIRCS